MDLLDVFKYIPIAALGIIVAGLVVSSGSKVLGNFRDDFKDDASASIDNESSMSSGGYVTPTVTPGAIMLSLTQIRVNSSGTLAPLTPGRDANLSSGLYGDGRIKLSSNFTSNTTHIWYTYATKEGTFNATMNTLDGNTEISKQFSTIGIIVAMTVILMAIGTLGAYFYFR